jgi:hypothetical protein
LHKFQASLTGVQQVPNNALDSLAVRVLRTVTGAGCLMDSKLDVRASVGGQVEEHSNSGWIGPLFSKWLSIFVRSQWFLSSRSCVRGCLVHSSVLNHLLGQALLGRLDGLTFPLELNSQEAKDVTILFQCKVITKILQLVDIGLNQIIVWAQPSLIITEIEDHQLEFLVDEKTGVSS